jgi:hypothetical protein
MPGIINFMDFVLHLILKDNKKLNIMFWDGFSPQNVTLLILCYPLKEEMMDE